MRPSRMRLILLVTPGLRPGSVGSLSLSAVNALQHRQGLLTPGASPGTMGDLKAWSFRPRRPRDALPRHPVLERAHRLVQRVALHGLFPCPPDEADDLVVRQPHGGPGAGLMVHALEHHRALEVVAPEAERHLRNERRHHGPMGL